MKKYILYLISLITLLSSCTEIIDIDLNSSGPQLVVEGSVSTSGSTKIKLTTSINFDKSNAFGKVEGAKVTISDNIGNQEILMESSPGIYTSTTLTGVQGNTYFLTIEKDTKTLKSHSTIPNQVAFDNLVIEKINSQGGGPGGPGGSRNYDVFVKYNDPSDITNYYRFVELVNGNVLSSYVFDDRINSGKTTSTLLNFSRNLDSGDELKVIMQCIDENVYDYFNSFGNLSGGPGGSSSPANPYTNIEGGVLGYFNAHTYESKTVIIP